MGHIQHLSFESLVKMDHFQKEPPLNLKGTTGAKGSEIPVRLNVRFVPKADIAIKAQLVRYWLRRCSPYNAEGVCRKVSRPNTTIPAMKDNGRLIYINPTSKKIANDDVWGGLQKRLRRR
jgi:hypothetical protein